MEQNFQLCKECNQSPLIYCNTCLRQYCYQHQDHKKQCDQIIHKVYGQTKTVYQQWLQKTTYFDNLIKNHMYQDAVQYVQVLKQHIQSQFIPESRFNAIQALQLREFFLQSQLANNTQLCNKLYQQHEFLRQNNDVLDIHQYIMFQEGKQYLQNSHKTIAQLNTINFCLYNQQLSTANVAFTSIKQPGTIHAHQGYMPFFQLTLIRLINTFPSNQLYRGLFTTMIKSVNLQISQYFKSINFIHFDQYEQTHFLVKIEIVIQMLNENVVSVADAYRIYNLFEELKPKFNNDVKLKLTSDFLLIKLGIACSKITSYDALNTLQKKKLISTVDMTIEQIEAINEETINRSTKQVVNPLWQSTQTQYKNNDSIYYLQHPLYHTFHIINKNENILKQIKKYARVLSKNSDLAQTRKNIDKVLRYSKISSQYNMSQLSPQNDQFYDDKYQKEYYKSIINQGTLQLQSLAQPQNKSYLFNDQIGDMTLGDLQVQKSQIQDQDQQNLNQNMSNLQSRASMAGHGQLAKSTLELLQQQSLVKINQQYIQSKIQQHEQQQEDSRLLLQECESVNLRLSQFLAASKKAEGF